MDGTCKDASRKRMLERYNVYMGICLDVAEVLAREACTRLFEEKRLIFWNKTRVNAFKEKIFKYTKANVALVNIFIREPYCTEMLQEVKFPL